MRTMQQPAMAEVRTSCTTRTRSMRLLFSSPRPRGKARRMPDAIPRETPRLEENRARPRCVEKHAASSWSVSPANNWSLTPIAMPTALNELTAAEAARRIAAGETTALALAEACLERIAQRDEEVRAWAFIH